MNHVEAVQTVRKAGLGDVAEKLVGGLAPSARLVLRDGAGPGGLSYFGGNPFLPTDSQWPRWEDREYLEKRLAELERIRSGHRNPAWLEGKVASLREHLKNGGAPLAFIAHISLRELAVAAPIPGWPAHGSLAFFYEESQFHWGWDPSHRGSFRVIHLLEGGQFIETIPPADLHPAAHHPKYSVEVRHEWTLPTTVSIDGKTYSIREEGPYRNLIDRLMPGELTGGMVHRSGGYPQTIQNDMRLECQLVTHGISCGDERGSQDVRVAGLRQGAADWRLLLQLDSDDKLKWMWGDTGRLYFWARQQDIEASSFANAWAILQCH